MDVTRRSFLALLGAAGVAAVLPGWQELGAPEESVETVYRHVLTPADRELVAALEARLREAWPPWV